MTVYIIILMAAVCLGMAISVYAFGTGGKRKHMLRDIYFSVEDIDGIGVLYTRTGEYSAILKMENPVQKYAADTDSFYDFTRLMTAIMAALGEGYALHKQDIFVRRKFYAESDRKAFLSEAYFRYFRNREYIDSSTYLTITQDNRKSALFSYDSKKWRDFLLKICKVHDLLKDGGVEVHILDKKEADEYVSRFYALNFKDGTLSMNNLKADSEQLSMGDKVCRLYSLVDVDCVSLPPVIRPFTNIEVNNATMPVDLMSILDNIPGADCVVYNQMVYVPGQKRELAQLEKKKNRHASMPSPSNRIAAEDIKRVQDMVARENRQLVYVHCNIAVMMPADTDMQKCANYLENSLSRLGIRISKRAYNQLELYVNSFPGNCYGMSADYDRFLTMSDVAACLMYKERALHSEDSPLKVYYTDRQGVPVAIDITGKEGTHKLTDNSNFFCLGPSGSGKSFHINSVVRQLWEQDTDIVMVDTGNSYEGLCEYVGGKYISYTEERPITMNPFNIRREELNIEKIGFLKNLVMLIWKGSQGTVTKTEDRLIEQVLNEYFDAHFSGRSTERLCFNSFYEFSLKRIPEICKDNSLIGINFADYSYLLKEFYIGGRHESTLNENLDSSLFDETFIVFEIDSIKDDPLLFPLVTLIIMDVFLQKMRIKKNRKCLVIEEAWKAIASPMMAEYIKYMYKTARKFWASVGVVTQEIQDIIGSPIVQEAIINNSDVVMLLDQSKFRERFDEIKSILGLTDVDCRKIFTINRLDNKDGRSFFREVFIRRGSTSGVYGVEEPHECYMTYTTERAEKEALKLYKNQLGCSHEQAIARYCADWEASGLTNALPFAQKVNQCGKVLSLEDNNTSLG